MLAISKPAALLLVALAALMACANAGLLGGAFAQDSASANGQQASALTISASFADKRLIAPDEQIELRLSRRLSVTEGKVAIVIGQTDLTSLFTVIENRLRYNPQVLPLPSGESEMVVYLVSPGGQWTEIARFTLRVSNEKPAQQVANAQEQAEKKEVEQSKNREEKKAEAEEKTTEEKTAEQNKSASEQPAKPNETAQEKQEQKSETNC